MVMAGLLVAQLPEGSGGLSSFYTALHTRLLCSAFFIFFLSILTQGYFPH